MRARAHEYHFIVTPQLIDEQKIAAYVAFPMVGPLAFQRVVVIFGGQSSIICDEKEHCLFEEPQIISAGMREALPILCKLLRFIAFSWLLCAFLLRCFFRCHQKVSSRNRISLA